MSENDKTTQAEPEVLSFYLQLLVSKRSVHQSLDPYMDHWRFSTLHPAGTYLAIRDMCAVMEQVLLHYLGEDYVKVVNEFNEKLNAKVPDTELLPLVKRIMAIEHQRNDLFKGMFSRPVV